MRGSPDGTLDPDQHSQETIDLAAYREPVSNLASSLGRTVNQGLKKREVLHPIPGL